MNAMIQFLMINHGDAPRAEWDQYLAMLRDHQHLIGESAVGPGVSADHSLISKAATPTITGYLLIQAKTQEKAQEIMTLCPVHKHGGTVEIFPLIES